MSIKKYFYNPKLKISNETLSKRKIGKILIYLS